MGDVVRAPHSTSSDRVDRNDTNENRDEIWVSPWIGSRSKTRVGGGAPTNWGIRTEGRRRESSVVSSNWSRPSSECGGCSQRCTARRIRRWPILLQEPLQRHPRRSAIPPASCRTCAKRSTVVAKSKCQHRTRSLHGEKGRERTIRRTKYIWQSRGMKTGLEGERRRQPVRPDRADERSKKRLTRSRETCSRSSYGC